MPLRRRACARSMLSWEAGRDRGRLVLRSGRGSRARSPRGPCAPTRGSYPGGGPWLSTPRGCERASGQPRAAPSEVASLIAPGRRTDHVVQHHTHGPPRPAGGRVPTPRAGRVFQRAGATLEGAVRVVPAAAPPSGGRGRLPPARAASRRRSVGVDDPERCACRAHRDPNLSATRSLQPAMLIVPHLRSPPRLPLQRFAAAVRVAPWP